MKILVYLHGFLSSPFSQKGQWLAQAAQENSLGFFAPDLNHSPLAVKDLLERMARRYADDELLVVGSSLGGFYARYLSQITGARSVLLNPAVLPWKYALQWLGEQPLDAGGSIVVKSTYPEELRALDVPTLTHPERVLTVLGTADQTLNWREGFTVLANTTRWVIAGADHRLSDFARLGPAVLAFLLENRLPAAGSGSKIYQPGALDSAAPE